MLKLFGSCHSSLAEILIYQGVHDFWCCHGNIITTSKPGQKLSFWVFLFLPMVLAWRVELALFWPDFVSIYFLTFWKIGKSKMADPKGNFYEVIWRHSQHKIYPKQVLGFHANDHFQYCVVTMFIKTLNRKTVTGTLKFIHEWGFSHSNSQPVE